MAKPIVYDYDKKGFDNAVALSVELSSKLAAQAVIQKQMEDLYFLRWAGAPKSEEVKVTVSPDPQVKLKNARRLLTSTVPIFKVPTEKNNPEAKGMSSSIEQMMQIMWAHSNHIQEVRVERDLAFSLLLHDMGFIDIVRTKDILQNLQDAPKQEDDPWEKKRWEGRLQKAQENADATPYIFSIVNARTVSALWGRSGMEMVYREVKRTVSDVKGHWGTRAIKALEGRKDTETVTECTLLDNTFRYTWIKDKKTEPIFADVHRIPCLPMAGGRAEGSLLFEETERQIEPFLRTLQDTGLQEFKNRILTSVNTNLSGTLEYQRLFTQGQVGDELKQDPKMLGVWIAPPNSRLETLSKDVVSKDIMTTMSLLDGMTDEMTMYDQAAGGGGGDNFSLLSLMNNMTRLPLSGTQDAMSQILARLGEKTFKWMKADDKPTIRNQYGKTIDLDLARLPDVIEFEVAVEVDLPQDDLQMANAGKTMKDLGASEEHVLSKYAKIENPEKMKKQVWKEKAREMLAEKAIGDTLQIVEQTLARLQGNGLDTASTPTRPPTEPPTEPTMQGGLPPVQAGPMPQQPPNMPSDAEMQGQVPPEMMNRGR